MNKRIKKKMLNKKPSNKDRMRFYRKRAQGMMKQCDAVREQNQSLIERLSTITLEHFSAKRENNHLSHKNIELIKKDTGLERELITLKEIERLQKKRIEEQEGEITLLKYKLEKYKGQLEECQKPLWKKVLGRA